MYTLFHHSFCPHSRFIRLALGEHGAELRLVEERVWERRKPFLALNPAGTTPVLISEGRPPIPGVGVIVEYLDEAYGRPSAPAGAEEASRTPESLHISNSRSRRPQRPF